MDITDKIFESEDFTTLSIPSDEFDTCTFRNCEMSGIDLSGVSFTNCTFTGCDLSMAKLQKSAFRDVIFKECKMIGLFFDECNTFGLKFDFHDCILDNCIFTGLKLKGTVFENCRIINADFSSCDLENSSFAGSNLSEAVFENTNLMNCDLRSVSELSLDPEKNKLKKAKINIESLPGLLQKHGLKIEF